MEAPLPTNEARRLNTLNECEILDTEPEHSFDDISQLAAYICGTPIALISLVDTNRQWFKSKVGFNIPETSRDLAFCAHTILRSDVLIVPDTLNDQRFATNPLVITDPHIRFYAGIPLVIAKSYPLGTLCVLDYVPRELSLEQIKALQALGRQATTQLELRRNLASVKRIGLKRKQAEDALWQSKEQFRNLVEQTNDWVWELDCSLVFTYVNPRVQEITGYEPGEILNRRLLDFMLPDEAVRFITVLDHFIQQQSTFYQLETTIAHKLGETITLEMSGSPIFNSQGELQGYRGITRDITERKQVERDIRKALTKEKELNELKTRFISMASHEFRTPLTTILASAESLEHYQSKWDDAKKRTVLQRIQSAAKHMTRLLNDVLTLGKAEAGKLEINPVQLNLPEFCTDLVEELQLSEGNQQRISLQLVDLCTEIWGDEKLLRHILVNLLSNALKYSPTNQVVQFHVSCCENQVTFQIQDQGIGIPPEDKKRLFESFYRATNVGIISGTGLGLTIVKRAVDACGGTITVSSAVGSGTTFTVSLPLGY